MKGKSCAFSWRDDYCPLAISNFLTPIHICPYGKRTKSNVSYSKLKTSAKPLQKIIAQPSISMMKAKMDVTDDFIFSRFAGPSSRRRSKYRVLMKVKPTFMNHPALKVTLRQALLHMTVIGCIYDGVMD